MYRDQRICAVIPARNEALSIATVVVALQQTQIYDQIIVCDNGSTDNTGMFAAAQGAEVVSQPVPGYGAACLAAISRIESADIVVFIDADNSLWIPESVNLVEAIAEGADLVIGSRVKAWREKNSMSVPQIFGNWLATRLIRMIWQVEVTDLGPFRAIRFDALKRLGMHDPRFGWTTEMQVKAIQYGLTTVEIPVHYRRRIGKSKISGTLSGIVGAGLGIMGTIARLALDPRNRSASVDSLPPRVVWPQRDNR